MPAARCAVWVGMEGGSREKLRRGDSRRAAGVDGCTDRTCSEYSVRTRLGVDREGRKPHVPRLCLGAAEPPRESPPLRLAVACCVLKAQQGGDF